jgi:ankyrin repeat protein
VVASNCLQSAPVVFSRVAKRIQAELEDNMQEQDLYLQFLLAIAAAQNGRLDEVHSILNKHSALLTWKDEHGATLLHELARTWCNLELVLQLIAAGADLDARTYTGDTLLELMMGPPSGVDDDSTIRVEALLRAGANPNAIMRDGSTALEKAIARDRVQIAKLLLESGADPTKPSSDLPPLSVDDVIDRSDRPEFWRELVKRKGNVQT